jgi:hypothetical protein
MCVIFIQLSKLWKAITPKDIQWNFIGEYAKPLPLNTPLLFLLSPNEEHIDLYSSLIPPATPCLFNKICILTTLSNKKTSKAIPNDIGNGTMNEILIQCPYMRSTKFNYCFEFVYHYYHYYYYQYFSFANSLTF